MTDSGAGGRRSRNGVRSDRPGGPPEILNTTLSRPKPSGRGNGAREGQASSGPTGTPRPPACLLALHPEDLRGRKYDLLDEDGPILVGRHPQNHICIPSGDVSRRHCCFERRGDRWWVIDNGSLNGTFVNDKQVDRATLSSGDRVTLGGPMMMFLAGEGMETRLIELVHSLSHHDYLLELPNKLYCTQALEREVDQNADDPRPMSVVLLRLDDLENLASDESLNDRRSPNRVGVDGVIKELAEVARKHPRPDDVFGKYDYGEFIWVLPGTTLGEARELAEALRRDVESSRFSANGRRIPVTVSGGIVQHEPQWDVGHLLSRAEAQLFRARQQRNTLRTLEASDSVKMRRPLDGEYLLRKLLAEDRGRALIAFEVDDEASVVETLGYAGFRNWLFELQQAVDDRLGSDELFGKWKDRYIVVTHASDDPATIQGFADLVAASFRASAPRWNEPGLERSIRHAMLQSAEVVACGERALEELVRKILHRGARRTESGSDVERLPHPLAVPHLIVSNRSTSLARATALCHGIELYLKFLVALELGWLRARGGAGANDGIVGVLRGVDLTQRLSFGAWLQLVRRLARLFPETGSDGVVPEVIRPLAAKRGPGARLQTRLAEAVQTRNGLFHSPGGQPEEGYESEESLLRETLGELTRLVRDLRDTRLISVKRIDSVDGDDDDDDEPVITYTVRDHRGPKELFPYRRIPTSASMKPGWCYLIDDGPKPISMAPLFWSGVCEQCRREELFVADDLWRGPLRQDPVALRGVTSNHPVKAEAALGKRERRFLEAWAATPRGRTFPGPDSLDPEATSSDSGEGGDTASEDR